MTTDPPMLLVGVYVPSSDRAPDKVERKRIFLNGLLAALRHVDEADRVRLVLCGDYNVIGRDHQPRYRAFLPFEYDFLDALAELGLVDVFADHHPAVQAHSWVGRGGNGYRFDYIHVAKPLASRTTACEYTHQPRLAGLTDHAAVTLTLDVTLAAYDYSVDAAAARSNES